MMKSEKDPDPHIPDIGDGDVDIKASDASFRTEINDYSPPSPGSAQINVGGLVAYSVDLSSQALDDVSDSLLFCHLAADKEIDRFAAGDYRRWVEKFVSMLSGIGWSVRSLEGTRAIPEDLAPTITQHALAVLERNSAPHVPLANRALRVVQEIDQTSRGFDLWNNRATRANQCAFYIAIAAPDVSGPQIHIVFINALYSPIQTHITDWVASATGSSEYQSLFLSGDIYDRVRQRIIERLGARRGSLTFPVPLAD